MVSDCLEFFHFVYVESDTYIDKYGLVEGVSLWLEPILARLKEVRGRCLRGRVGRSQNAAVKKLLGCQIAHHSSGSAAKSLLLLHPRAPRGL